MAASDHAILCILTCPSGPYFQRPISLLAVSDVVRAWPGGTGGHKVAGNYSPGFVPLREAVAQGYDQVLWLFGEEKWVTEGGAMNVFVVLKRANGDGTCSGFSSREHLSPKLKRTQTNRGYCRFGYHHAPSGRDDSARRYPRVVSRPCIGP